MNQLSFELVAFYLHTMKIPMTVTFLVIPGMVESLKFPEHVRLPEDLTLVSEHEKAALEDSQNQVVSFLDATIKSMQNSQNAVIKSNEELDADVRSSKARLDTLTRSFFKHERAPTPLSLLQVRADSELDSLNEKTFDESNADSGLALSDRTIFRKPHGPSSILELAKARAAASEKKYRDAMKRLESDKEFLVKDESVRRARAAQERRHLNLQK